jgi:Methyltransferase domain
MSPLAPVKMLYNQNQLPIFQNRMYESELEAKNCPKGDIELVEDQLSGLIYNAKFHAELVVYDANYQNEQACSPFFKHHLESVSQIIDRNMGRDSIIEVGCGKGVFLEMLLSKGFDIVGFDPTYEGTNPKVTKRYVPRVGLRANGLVLRHVLEHIHDPFNFLLQLKEANGGGGKVYIEVPCFDWICKHRAWFDIFYEHVNYFRISDFYRMFESILESGHLFGGQYLFVIAELATLTKPKLSVRNCVKFPHNFADSVAVLSGTTHDRTAIWGAASKGVIFALLKERAGQRISTVIDINPAKQGKYLPSTGLLIKSPSEGLGALPTRSTIYVMNSNYLEEIKQMSNNAFKYITYA